MDNYMRVRADINLDAIHHNLQQVKSKINKNSKLMAVIKADGYGHGAGMIAKYCDDVIDSYAVAIVEEGIALRQEGFTKPILLLGYTHPSQYEDLLKYNLTPAIFSFDMAKPLSDLGVKAGKTLKVHIKLDTGMSRIGFVDNSVGVEEVVKISKLPNIEIEGIFSHLARADEKDKIYANAQFQRFTNFYNKLKVQGVNIPIRHISNSAAIMELQSMNLELVRSGIITYGLYPSEEVDKGELSLVPAMELKTHISYIKTLPSGVAVGYGGTYVTKGETVVATIPVGYADGYPRSLSNKGEVIINGKRASIIGRICMDQFMVDVTHIPNVKVGDTVTLMGRDKEEFIPCEEVANLAGSFNYEFVCDISKRVPRVYYFNNKVVCKTQWICHPTNKEDNNGY
jgi:alanine racemase